jgi:hypothetical protein
MFDVRLFDMRVASLEKSRIEKSLPVISTGAREWGLCSLSFGGGWGEAALVELFERLS